MTVNHQRRSLGNEIDKQQIADGRLARFAVIHGERAEHLASTGQDRDRPAGTQVMRKGNSLELRPQGIVGDIGDEDRRTEKSGSAARSRARADLEPVDRFAIFLGQAGSSALT